MRSPEENHPREGAPPDTVLVTGARGFVGSHLAAALVARGARVIGVDKRPGSREVRAASVLRPLQGDPGFRLVTASACSPEVTELLTRASTVIHLAAATDVAASWGEGFAEHAASVLTTQRLLDNCAHAGVRRVVVASSCHVYGPAAAGGLAREDLCTEPTSPYGVAKLAAERLAVAYARRPESQMSVVALRFFPAFGPGCNPAMVIPKWFTAALSGIPVPLYGDGDALHSWTYVSDLVEATIRAAAVPMSAGNAEVVNVAGPDQASLREVADLIGEITGRSLALEAAGERAGDSAAIRADLTKARRFLRFTPQVGLREALLRQWQNMAAIQHDAQLSASTMDPAGA